MTAATEPVGESQVFPRPHMETLFKDRYVVSGSGNYIAKWFKDPAHVSSIIANKLIWLWTFAENRKPWLE